MQEPGGTYGVNQNFTVSFDLKNTGAVAAKDIVVTAEGVDSTAVVPKSASMKNIQSLAPEQRKSELYFCGYIAVCDTESGNSVYGGIHFRRYGKNNLQAVRRGKYQQSQQGGRGKHQ